MPSNLPGAVLFACSQNAIRSPMAEGLMRHFYGRCVYVQSCGVRTGEPDGFVVAVMDELGIDLTRADLFERLKIEDEHQGVTLRFRQKGAANQDAHRLKRLFQRHRVPPWQRDTTAQVYLDGQLSGLLL